MNTVATKENRPAFTTKRAQPYVHYPIGPAQQAQQRAMRKILRPDEVNRNSEDEEEPVQEKLIQRQADKQEEELLSPRLIQRKVSDMPGSRPPISFYPGSELKAQQRNIHRILHTNGGQPKLSVGQPNDTYEQEADRIADQVMAMSGSTLQRKSGNVEEEESVQTKPLSDQITPLVQRQEVPPQEEEVQARLFRSPAEHIQAKGTPELTDEAAQKIKQMRGQGDPLPKAVRQETENKIGADFSRVRIHNSGAANDINKQINARAFTFGNDIFFAPGEYSPTTDRGKQLLAHELTHVVQQSSGAGSKLRRTNTVSSAPPGGTGGGGVYQVTAGEYSGTEIDIGQRRIRIAKISLPNFKERNSRLYTDPIIINPMNRSEIPTNHQQNWRRAVNSEARSQVQELAGQARDRGGVNESGQLFFQARRRDDFILFGSESELEPRFEIPIWDRNKLGRSFQVDHIKEIQLSGTDVVENYELLDATANMSAGWRLGNPESGGEIGFRIRQALRKLREENPTALNQIPRPTEWRDIRYGYRANNGITFASHDYNLRTNGDGEEGYWSLNQIRQGAATRLLRPMREQELRRMGREGSLVFFASPQGGARMPMARRIPMRNWIPRVDLLSWEPNQNVNTAGDLAGTLAVDAFKSSSGRQRAQGVSVPPDYPSQTWNVRKIDGIHGGYLDINQPGNARGVQQSLRLPGMSPIELDTFQVNADGMHADGRVLPTVPLIRDADIRLRIDGDNIELRKTFAGPEIQVPPPFEINDTELTVFYGTRGLGIEGRVGFGIDKIGEGFLGAAASTGAGFALDGEFNFDERIFGEGTQAQVRVGYANNQWSMGGTLSIPQGKVPGINSATINVDYSEAEGFAASGDAELDVPGVDSGRLEITHSEENGFSIGGDFDLSPDTPGIRSGSISAQVREREDSSGYAVSASGTAVPDIPGVNSELSVNYNDGAFTAEVNAQYERGMLSGEIQAGVTNRSVNEETGELSETAEENNPLIVYGGGSLTIQIAPWLQGTAGVRFAPNGEITVSGEIALPDELEIFARREINRSIFNIAVQAPIFPGIVAEIGGGLGATAGIGPGVIDELRLGITYNPAREEDTTIIGDAHLNVPADAGLRLSVRAGIGLGITGASATGGLEIGGTLGIEGAAEAGVRVEWSPSQGLDLTATVSVHAEPAFTFDISGYVSVRALGFSVYDETWELASFRFGSDLRFGIRLPIHYQEGQPFDISTDDIEFEVPDIDTDRLLKGLISRIA